VCLTGENDVDVCLRGEDNVFLREEEGGAVAEGEEGCVVCMYFFGAGEKGEEVLRSVDDFLMAGDEDWK